MPIQQGRSRYTAGQVREKYRAAVRDLPHDESIEGMFVIAIVAVMSVASTIRRLWSWWLLVVWIAFHGCGSGKFAGAFSFSRPVNAHEWADCR